MPAATALIPIVRFTLALTLTETDELGVAVFVMSRVVAVEKSTWVGVGARVVVVESSLGAVKEQKQTSAKRVSVYVSRCHRSRAREASPTFGKKVAPGDFIS